MFPTWTFLMQSRRFHDCLCLDNALLNHGKRCMIQRKMISFSFYLNMKIIDDVERMKV